ncbi:MAG: Cna B-type domain-containing protein [Solobacterium sp.]|uniref:Cna B-type domain-containing protein n=1 Tax=Solobacterium sp. TaxID=2060878 RepID=UPI001CAE3174|nr:Cna B-type domain-containing protein [Solobacterium sp.]MBF1088883.1 Cna B-type domain-containing protein [Solobacterium sp.]
MSMRKLQRIFVIVCAFIMLLSVNNSVNAIDTTTPALTTTVTTAASTPINPNEKIEILFRSLWTGNDRLSARVHLFADGEELNIQTTDPSTGLQRDGIILDYQNAWEYRQANLPRYDQDGNEITYTATQEIINEDLFAFHGLRFKTVTTGSSEERYFIFKNISIINIKVGKTWNEYPNIVIPGTPSPANPPVMLNVNTLDSEYSASYDEEELNELVAESDALDANDLSYAAYTSGLDEVDTSLEEDAQATAAQQSSVAIPDSITVNLLADGVVVGTIQVTKEQDWESEFVGYPRFDENDGHEINYTIEEVPVNGYKTEYVHTRVIDMIINRSIIDIPVVKKWVGKMQSSVHVTLHRKYTTTYFDYATYRNVTDNHDEVVETVELNAANNWQHIFREQYEFYTVAGQDPSKYEYYITEDSVANYATDITGNQDDGFTITNTNTTDLIDIPVEKNWDGGYCK